MSDNKTSKYLKYAIGEIVLVVIGILIAISINTWNERRINKTFEKELLNNLISDVEIDIQNLKIQDSVLALAFISKEKLLSFIKGEKQSSDSIFYYLSKSGPLSNFNANTITYDEMKNSEGFKVISDKAIRREIAILYKQYEMLKSKEAMYFESHARLRNIRIEDFSTGSLKRIGEGEIRDPNQILDQVKTNRRFINALESNFVRNLSVAYKETLQKAISFKDKLSIYLIKG